MPMRQPSSTVQPCRIAAWPTVTSRPTVTGKAGSPCRIAASWMLEPLPTRIVHSSPRSTALYQTLARSSNVTLPTRAALSAARAVGCRTGVCPWKFWIIADGSFPVGYDKSRALPHHSTRADRRENLCRKKARNRRNTFCIARFCNAFVGQIGRQDVRGELSGDTLILIISDERLHGKSNPRGVRIG